jgi:prefoldin subunit 5
MTTEEALIKTLLKRMDQLSEAIKEIKNKLRKKGHKVK